MLALSPIQPIASRDFSSRDKATGAYNSKCKASKLSMIGGPLLYTPLSFYDTAFILGINLILLYACVSNKRACFRAAVSITLSVARVDEHMLIFKTFNLRRSA